MSAEAHADAGHSAGLGVLAAASVSALVLNANSSAVTILLRAISEDLVSSGTGGSRQSPGRRLRRTGAGA